MMAREISAVLEYGAPAPGGTAAVMADKLRFHTDSWDCPLISEPDFPASS
jgi:hypothetical protein